MREILSMIKISVVIPVYNRAEWIGETLDRIFNQKHDVFEVVICDDGSTDALAEALQPYGAKIKLITITNSGPAIARKTAIDHATGDWVALCDSDDFWHEDHIQNFVSALAAYPATDVYFSNFWLSDQKDTTKFDEAAGSWFHGLCNEQQSESKSHYYRCRQPFLGALLEFQACFPSCLVFRKDFYERIGGIKVYISRWRSEDFHLTARMAAQARATVSVKPTVMINKHSGNFSAEHVENLKGEVDILVDIWEHSLVPQPSLDLIAKQLVGFKLRLFRAYYWSAKYGEAVAICKQLPRQQLNARDLVRMLASLILRVFQKT